MTWQHPWPVSSWCSYICWTGFSCAPLLGHRLPWGGTDESKSMSFLCTYYWQYIFHLSLSLPPLPSKPSLNVCFFLSRWPHVCIDCSSRRKATKVPSFRRVLSDRTGGRAGDGELQGPCIRGERESLWGTHITLGEEGGWGRSVWTWSSNSAWWCCVPCSSCSAWPRSSCWMEARAPQPADATSERFVRSGCQSAVVIFSCVQRIYISKQCANIYILI